MMKIFALSCVGTFAAAATVDVNHATVAQLDTLYGVGASTAQKIVDYRTKHGDFASLADVAKVAYVTDSKIAKWAETSTVNAIICPTVRCADPAPCSYVASALLNADGCPAHPCGIKTCPAKESCCDPTNPLHISKTTTCSVEKESCMEWVEGLAASKWHYQGGAASKKAADLASRVCAKSGNKPHYWIKVKHANPNVWDNTVSDNFRCARGGDKATPGAAAQCMCCECKNGVAHIGAQASSVKKVIAGATATESKTETITAASTAASTTAKPDMDDKGEQNCGLAHKKPCATQWLPNDGCSKDTTLAKPFNDNSCWPCGDDNELACKFKFQDNQGCGPDDTLAKGGDASKGSHNIGDHHGFNEVNPNPHPAGKCWTCGGDNQPRCDNKYASNNGCKDGHSGTHAANKCWICTRGNVNCE